MARPARPDRLRSIALAACLGLALTGCSSGGTLVADESPLRQALGPIPLAGYSDFPVDGSPDEWQAYSEQKVRQTEDLVAQCMTDAGWEYIPDPGSIEVSVSEFAPSEPDSREWVAQYGYGLIRSPEAVRSSQPSAPRGPSLNEEYRSSLSDSAREEYEATLSGVGSTVDENGGYQYRWQDAGCVGWAEHEVDGDGFKEASEFKPLIEALARFEQISQADPRFAAIDADWAACMDEAGHSGFTRQTEAQESIRAMIETYLNHPDAEYWLEEFGTTKDPAYAAIADTELPLALADLECRQQTDHTQRRLRVQFELEEQFVADHADQLAAARERFGRKQ